MQQQATGPKARGSLLLAPIINAMNPMLVVRLVGFSPRALCCLGLAVALVSRTATGAESPAPESLAFGITPFVGYRTGGDFKRFDTQQPVNVADHGSLALALDVRAVDAMQYELFYGRQSTVLSGAALAPATIKVEYLHLGGTVPLLGTPHLNPYYGGGLGITRLSPDPAVGVDNTRFSLSLSLGTRVPLSPHLALRFEARGFFTPMPTDTAFFCRSDQTGALCEIRARGSWFVQGDVLAGAAFTF